MTLVFVINDFIVDGEPPHAKIFGLECYWSYRWQCSTIFYTSILSVEWYARKKSHSSVYAIHMYVNDKHNE